MLLQTFLYKFLYGHVFISVLQVILIHTQTQVVVLGTKVPVAGY